MGPVVVRVGAATYRGSAWGLAQCRTAAPTPEGADDQAAAGANDSPASAATHALLLPAPGMLLDDVMVSQLI